MRCTLLCRWLLQPSRSNWNLFKNLKRYAGWINICEGPTFSCGPWLGHTVDYRKISNSRNLHDSYNFRFLLRGHHRLVCIQKKQAKREGRERPRHSWYSLFRTPPPPSPIPPPSISPTTRQLFPLGPLILSACSRVVCCGRVAMRAQKESERRRQNVLCVCAHKWGGTDRSGPRVARGRVYVRLDLQTRGSTQHTSP